MANAAGTPILLIKKVGGLFLVLAGFLLLASGLGSDSRALTTLGSLTLVGGLALLVLKIMRRNAP